jgi:hypothetical protein
MMFEEEAAMRANDGHIKGGLSRHGSSVANLPPTSKAKSRDQAGN